MTPSCAVLFLLAIIQLIFMVFVSFYFFKKGREFPVLEERTEKLDPVHLPRISLVIAARNEARNIENCVNSIFLQDYPNLEVVVVNDRSSDSSENILANLKKQYPSKLTVINLTQLPNNWGGQNHAIHQGVKYCTGEWLCFTDADCKFLSARILRLAYDEAMASGSTFISLLPQLTTKTSWEKFYMPIFSFIHAMRLGILNVNNSASPAAYANGSFMLIHVKTYKKLGGHEQVKLLINDDTRLARIAKSKDIKLKLLGNRGLYETEMYNTLRSAWFGWTRNTYSSIYEGASLLATIAMVVGLAIIPWLLFVICTAYAFILGGPWAALAAFWSVPVLFSQAAAALIYKAFNFNPVWSLLYFPAAIFALCILINCQLKAIIRSDIIWHGVRYPAPKKFEQ